MEKIIRDTLQDKPRPRLSSGFAADVTESLETRESRKKITARATTVLAINQFLILCVSRSAQYLAREGVGGLAFINDEDAIHQYVFHSL
jgi:hypothetical protein